MFATPIRTLIRPALWLGFFASILWAWWFLYQMAMSMDLDLIGRPGPMGQAMADMDPSETTVVSTNWAQDSELTI